MFQISLSAIGKSGKSFSPAQSAIPNPQLKTNNSQPAHFAIKQVTASSRPSRVNSNMGKISRMALMLRV